MKISQPMVDDWERWATNPKVIPPLESNDWDRDQYQLLQLVKIFHIPTIHKFSSDVPQVEHLQTTVSFFFGENFCWWISGTHINLFCVHPDQNLLRLIHQHASLRNDYVNVHVPPEKTSWCDIYKWSTFPTACFFWRVSLTRVILSCHNSGTSWNLKTQNTTINAAVTVMSLNTSANESSG